LNKVAKAKKSYRDHSKQAKLSKVDIQSPSVGSTLTSPIITLTVGRDQRLFAAHEEVLCKAPFFATICRSQFMESAGKRIDLPDEEPVIFSSVLEYLYKGDYIPAFCTIKGAIPLNSRMQVQYPTHLNPKKILAVAGPPKLQYFTRVLAESSSKTPSYTAPPKSTASKN